MRDSESSARKRSRLPRPKADAFVISILTVSLLQIAINESYKFGKGYITIWEAADALSPCGLFLSFIGIVTLDLVAVLQNIKAQKLYAQLKNQSRRNI